MGRMRSQPSVTILIGQPGRAAPEVSSRRIRTSSLTLAATNALPSTADASAKSQGATSSEESGNPLIAFGRLVGRVVGRGVTCAAGDATVSGNDAGDEGTDGEIVGSAGIVGAFATPDGDGRV